MIYNSKKSKVNKCNLTKKKGDTLSYLKRNKYVYFLILPAMICTLIFGYMPILGISIVFKEYNVIDGILGSPWVGLENFITVFKMPNVLHAMKNTFIYGMVFIFGGTPFAIIFALLLNELKGKMFKKVIQTISYLPYFLSWVSVVAIFYSFFSLNGAYNDIMGKIFGEAYVAKNILMDSKFFLPIIFASNVWKGLGWSAVIYLAAISGVDPSLYEAAEMDGCGKFRQALKITIPSITPTIVVVFIMSIGTLVSANFEQIYGFQNIYTQEDTEVINTLTYRMGIEQGNYSLSTAFGLAQGLVSFVILQFTNWASKKITDMSVW